MAALIDKIRRLEEEGILGPEECPDPDYWHWRVPDPSLLPQWMLKVYDEYGEIRWYGGYDY